MQKNMLRHMHQKRYQILKRSTVKIQALYRRRRAMAELKRRREEKAAITIQKYWRRYIQRKRYLRAKKAVHKLQTGKFILFYFFFFPESFFKKKLFILN
jgi:myosin V